MMVRVRICTARWTVNVRFTKGRINFNGSEVLKDSRELLPSL